MPFINIFSKQIPLYGVMFYIGIALAAIVAVNICKKRGLPAFEIVYSAVYVMIGALLGSKLLFIIVSWDEIIKYDLSLIQVIKGGFVFYGGLIGGALGLIIYTRQFAMKLIDFVDVYATVLPLGHACGRVGCFFAGCCYGMEYDGFLSHTYTASAGLTPLGIPLLPIQLIEAVCLLVLFAILLAVYFKSKKFGFVSKVYLVSYSILRFVLEFFRGDSERGKLFLLSTSQWVSILLVILVFVLTTVKRCKEKE